MGDARAAVAAIGPRVIAPGTALLASFFAERGRWPLWLPVFLGTGIGIYFWLHDEPARWIGPAALALSIVLAFGAWRARWGGEAAAVLLALSLGFAAAQLQAHWVAAPVLERRINGVLEGRVLAVDPLPEGARITIAPAHLAELDPAKLPLRVRVRLRHGDGGVAPGDDIRVRASLEPPPAPAMPGAYDFERRAWFDRLGGVGYAFNVLEILPSSETHIFRHWLEALRHTVTARIRAALPGPDGAIASALLTGETHAIKPEDAGAFRDAGLAHILVIAGLHMGMVAGACFFGVRAILALIPRIALNHPTKKYAAAAALAMTFGYLLLSGMAVSSRRAFVMTALALLAVLIDRLSVSARALALAATIIMLMTPESATGPSFQMSFAAVAGLVAFYEAFRDRIAAWHRSAGRAKRIGLYVLGIAFTTIVTTVATAPLTTYHFNRFPIYSVAANVIAVPITGFWVMPWGVIACLLMPLHLETLALIPMSWGIDVIGVIAKGVTSWPGAVVNFPSQPAWGMAVASLGGVWLAIWQLRWRYWGLLPLVFGLATIWWDRPPDVLISSGARLFAVRSINGDYLPSQPRGDRMTEENWTRRAAANLGPVWPASGVADDGRLHCDAGACVYAMNGQHVTLIRDPERFDRRECNADLVIAGVPAWRLCPRRRIIDRIDVLRNGGYAIRLGPEGMDVQSVRAYQGTRLWSPHHSRRTD